MGEPTYTIELTKRAIEQLEKIKKSATKAAKERLERIFAELAYTPMNSRGFASPERLRNYPNEEVQTGARMLIERWKKQLEN